MMALIKCRECGSQISSSAKACPQCGSPPPKKTKASTLIIGGMFIVIVGSMVAQSVRSNSSSASATAPTAPPARTAEQVKADREVNTVLAGARMLKEAMKKPESFELVNATMIDGKVICYEYRARNSFNDRRTERYVVSDNVSSSKPADWNNLCAGKSGTDYSHVRAVM